MKKFLIATVVAVFAAVAFTALSVAAPWSGSARAKADAANRLPALPAEVRQRRRRKIGVKCDFPPFGYINRQNKLAGKDVDIIISTLTWTASREEVIDYSSPYYNATGRLLVPNNSPVVTGGLRALGGRRVTTTRGSIYDAFLGNCFSGATKVLSDTSVGALEILRSGRADVYMYDDTFLLGVAANDANLRMTSHKFLNVPYGIGIRKNEPVMKRWVNAAILQMKRNDEFWRILRANSPRQFWRFFLTNVPRPRTREAYPRGRTPERECPR